MKLLFDVLYSYLNSCVVFENKDPTRRFSVSNLMLFLVFFSMHSPLHATEDWLPPPQNLSGSDASSISPKIATFLDGSGKAVAVWVKGSDIQSKIYDPSGFPEKWGDLLQVGSGNSPDYLQVVTFLNGKAIAVWVQGSFSPTNNRVVYAAVYDPNGSPEKWGEPAVVSSAGAAVPIVAAFSDGKAVVVWTQSSAIYSSIYDPDGSPSKWTNLGLLSPSGGTAFSPTVATFSDGKAVALWGKSGGVLQSKIYDPNRVGSEWGDLEDLSTMGSSINAPKVATFLNGQAVASGSGGGGFIEASIYDPNGSPKKWEDFTRISSVGQNSLTPQVATFVNGKAVVVWYRLNGPGNIIQSAIYDPNGSPSKWGDPEDLSEIGLSAYQQQVATFSDGKAVSLWYRYNGTNNVIQSTTYDPNSTSLKKWSSPTTISEEGRNASSPQLATFLDEKAIAVWYRNNGMFNIIQSINYGGVPSITSINPSSGPGLTTITINGTYLLPNPIVKFGDNIATILNTPNAMSIEARAPVGSGTVHVTVQTDNGVSLKTDSDLYTYVPPTPYVTINGSTTQVGTNTFSGVIEWLIPENLIAGSVKIKSLVVYRGLSPTKLKPIKVVPVTDPENPPTLYSDPNLQSRATYFYRIDAKLSDGSTYELITTSITI